MVLIQCEFFHVASSHLESLKRTDKSAVAAAKKIFWVRWKSQNLDTKPEICWFYTENSGFFPKNFSLTPSFSYCQVLLHKKCGRSIFFSYCQVSLTRISLTLTRSTHRSDCTEENHLVSTVTRADFPGRAVVRRLGRVSLLFCHPLFLPHLNNFDNNRYGKTSWFHELQCFQFLAILQKMAILGIWSSI